MNHIPNGDRSGRGTNSILKIPLKKGNDGGVFYHFFECALNDTLTAKKWLSPSAQRCIDNIRIPDKAARDYVLILQNSVNFNT